MIPLLPSEQPLFIQQDGIIYLHSSHPDAQLIHRRLIRFCQWVKSAPAVYTYRITPLSLWQAASQGMQAEEIISCLERFSAHSVSSNLRHFIKEETAKLGSLRLVSQGGELYLLAPNRKELDRLLSHPSLTSCFLNPPQTVMVEGQLSWGAAVAKEKRGQLKQGAVRFGYPICDQAGYEAGDPLPCQFAPERADGLPFRLRPYQQAAVDAFFSSGHGVVVLPCGAGKTIVGLATIVRLQCATLIVTTHTSSVKQWKQELVEKTTLTADQIGEYTGQVKMVKPVTITTYQMLIQRPGLGETYNHLARLKKEQWGLIIYDEVHLLPAPVFRVTAEAWQSTQRLGLTATLVREDGREDDVFSLIGPKVYELPWRELEEEGHIAPAACFEVRVEMTPELREAYHLAPPRRKMRLAQENPAKLHTVRVLLDKHRNDQILILGYYVGQLEELGRALNIPVLTGKRAQGERDAFYRKFRLGEIRVLALSRVGNFAIDLPEASVAIQISGTYGSRQEEAQRLGRILRPKSGGKKAYFYHIVTARTVEQEYAFKRRRFLTEQGYQYHVLAEEGLGDLSLSMEGGQADGLSC